ncbi:MAG: DUF4369 domain-containing protein [Tannerellaceae bacterium]|jgi:hypothetical protein|nr:DUF4369 domain-containing protein [Tannerellaceae bacterium]
MKKSLFLVSILLFVGCNDKNNYMEINGELRTDKGFNDEVIYLLPVGGNNTSSANKDSAIVKDGRFAIRRKADSAYIAMLRTKNPLQSYFLQPLLVAIEPGTLEVRLDSVSYSNGTPLNNRLQTWKEKKSSFDYEEYRLRQLFRKAEDSEKAVLEAQLAQNGKEYSEYNFNFVRENKDNPVGRFIYSMTKFLFTEEQRKTLDMPE